MNDKSKQNGSLTQTRNSELDSTQQNGASKQPKSKYVPPHLRNKAPPQQENKSWADVEPTDVPRGRDFPSLSSSSDSVGSTGHRDGPGSSRGFGNSPAVGRSSYGGRGRDFGDSAPRSGRWVKEEPNPFENQPPRDDTKIDFDKYDEIPVETSGKDCPKPIESWDEVDLGERLATNIKLARYDRPTPVQKYSLPIVLGGRDLMGCAQTGSGKTASFLFPIIAQMLKMNLPPTEGGMYSRRKIQPYSLILAPTRELACQIHDEAKKFGYKTGLRCVVLYGGEPVGQQLRELERGCDIIVATPGRLSDIMDRARLSLSQIRWLILDEADRMLDMGFEPQIRHIVEQVDMPPTGQRQTLMFSATFPKEIQRLASSFLDNYVFLSVGRVGSTTDLVTQKFLRVDERDKTAILLDLISSVPGLTIIFVETKRKADMLEDFLVREGFAATSIHGDRVQADRTAALRAFSSGQAPYLIATNVAARGLDIDNITHVINYDMPADIDDYVHRIGRTGRAGKPGLATALVSEENTNVIPKLLEILTESSQEIPPWLENLRTHRGYGGGGGHRGRGGPRFGGRDYRQERGGGNQRGGGDSWSREGGYHGGHNGGSHNGGGYNGSGGGGGSWW